MSLFMFGMVLNRHGEAADDADSLALMGEQLVIFQQQLQSESGLMVHADDWVFPFDTDIYWGRGNSWVTIALAEHLRVRFVRGESNPGAEEMFRDHVAGVLASQDPSGAWWTVMNRAGDTDNYLETSATALFAYGLARAYRYGFVGEPKLSAAKRAVEAARSKVILDEQGRPVVTGISQGTEPSTYEVYTSRELQDDRNYGVGAVILALIETSGL
jgi:unsaturated rhamnogalacturonyl hydrolase